MGALLDVLEVRAVRVLVAEVRGEICAALREELLVVNTQELTATGVNELTKTGEVPDEDAAAACVAGISIFGTDDCTVIADLTKFAVCPDVITCCAITGVSEDILTWAPEDEIIGDPEEVIICVPEDSISWVLDVVIIWVPADGSI